MGLKDRNGQPLTATELAASETIPKVCIVGSPQGGGHLATRYFTPQTGHASLAVSGGCCLAAAALIPGTVAHRLAQGLPEVPSALTEVVVALENPAGLLRATVVARQANAEALHIERAAYERSAQLLLRGYVPLYAASPALAASLQELLG
jgi:4-oxalomesaconate tautomerase